MIYGLKKLNYIVLQLMFYIDIFMFYMLYILYMLYVLY